MFDVNHRGFRMTMDRLGMELSFQTRLSKVLKQREIVPDKGD